MEAADELAIHAKELADRNKQKLVLAFGANEIMAIKEKLLLRVSSDYAIAKI